MVVHRREVWWADLDEPRGSEPGFRRPVLIVQAEAFNRSRLKTGLCVILPSDSRLDVGRGNVLVRQGDSGLPRDSVANVTQVVTLDQDFLAEKVGRIPPKTMAKVDAGLRLVLDL